MLERIDMDVIDVRDEIRLIAYQMLPETALPDAALAFCGGGYRVSANPWVPSAKNRP